MAETKPKPPYATVIVREVTDAERIGVMKTSEWFNGEAHVLPMFMREGYVVARWAEYSDGQTIKVEGRSTIAACAKMEVAMLVFNATPR